MKLSIVVPVYYNADSLEDMYHDLKERVLTKLECEYELIFVNDGSGDESYQVMKKLKEQDDNIRNFSLSRNFGSHAAILCGLEHITGDCAVVKAADMQEPSELILDMLESWKKGNNVVLAVRQERNESLKQKYFANLYYTLVRKMALSNMPEAGFDIYLVDKKVVNVLSALDEKNSSLACQILWSGFKTDMVPYVRLARQVGKSRWTLAKKLRLVMDTLFSFSTVPIKAVTTIGIFSFCGAIIWAIVEIVFKLMGMIDVNGWTTLFIFNLFSFGVIMLTLGILGEYLWRTFDASRNRPPYIVEDDDK
ncbi:MAG: glycosyltransferase family 2 protein [Lachnospiraceae bacterium]|nr:glycosyltransferase family 2 protein [Lachnospiraceae bacterium]